MKSSELTDAALDWAVAKCEGYECEFDDEVSGPWLVPQEGYLHDKKPLASFRPSTNWARGGPIIERERITLNWVVSNYLHVTGCWSAHIPQTNGKILYAPTPLIAAMRCYVASKLGDEVEVPEELL